MHVGPHLKLPSFLSDFNERWIFWTDFQKILKVELQEYLILTHIFVLHCNILLIYARCLQYS
jgi:hypothetical protein